MLHNLQLQLYIQLFINTIVVIQLSKHRSKFVEQGV
jgi:hypothetical protein